MINHDDIVKLDKFATEEGKPPLRAIRERLGGISQEEFARRIGVSLVTVSRWERGVTPATFTLKQLKAFVREVHKAGYDLQTLPDNLSTDGTLYKKKS